uniref:Association with the SNF1 complex (ASC) domain-containing protein n=1 Tax=Sciurus vulgaris TaxID=55149 RepID=A0A8D2AUY8_SCIVU
MVDSQKCSDVSGLSRSPPGPYHQEPYVFKPEERFKAPPILPPHLLQVILNKDTGISCDPALLPEPNHVMLNHLYALSIKDGVMVLSATHRYKKMSPPCYTSPYEELGPKPLTFLSAPVSATSLGTCVPSWRRRQQLLLLLIKGI